jgi:hypothetical protein
MLRLHLQQIAALDAAIAEIDREVDANLTPFRTGVELLTSIPGISTLSAQVIISEIGTDMSRFPTAGHLISCLRDRTAPAMTVFVERFDREASFRRIPDHGAGHEQDDETKNVLRHG